MVNEEATSQVSPDNCGGSAATIPSATSGVQQTATTAAPRDQFLEAWRRLDVTAAEHPRFARTLAQGLDVVRRALDEFDGSDPKAGEGGGELAISFNGGKDACVVLYLLLLVLAERDQLDRLSASRMTNDKARHRIRVVYFEKDEFPEMEAFMKDVSETYGFEFLTYALSYKDGMQDLVESYGVKGVIMGQRRGDPWTEGMQWFTPSTPGWAEFTRINPVLEWKFCEIWRFLRGSGLPYCVLYDQGYTSLGERGDTLKNEALRLPDGEYRPAYELAEEEEHLERSPRNSHAQSGGGDHVSNANANDANNDVQYGSCNGVDGGVKFDGQDEPDHAERNSGKHAAAELVLKRRSAWDLPERGEDSGPTLTRRDVGLFSGEGELAAGVGRGSGSPTSGDGFHGGETEGTEIAKLASRACLPTTDRKDDGLSPGWAANGARWLPVTVMVALVFAAVGVRRTGPLGGGVEGKGS